MPIDRTKVIAKSEKGAHPNFCVIDARAQVHSIGGLVLLIVCVVVTIVFVFIFIRGEVTGAQQIISLIMFFACWGYFINSATEKLHLTETELVFRSFMGRSRNVPLKDLQELTVQHNGFSLDQGFKSIEILSKNKKVDRILLGPCWKRSSLDNFLNSLQDILNTK